MNAEALVIFATAMFTILNPIGGVAIVAGMVAGRPEADRRSIAIKCSIAVAVILVATIWAGEYVLGLFGVTVSSLQAAGGLMIALISLSMLHGTQSAIHDTKQPIGISAVVAHRRTKSTMASRVSEGTHRPFKTPQDFFLTERAPPSVRITLRSYGVTSLLSGPSDVRRTSAHDR